MHVLAGLDPATRGVVRRHTHRRSLGTLHGATALRSVDAALSRRREPAESAYPPQPMTVCAPCTPTREFSKHIYYGLTKGLCRVCKRSVDVKIQFEDDKVYFAKFCPEHGHERVVVASSVALCTIAVLVLSPLLMSHE